MFRSIVHRHNEEGEFHYYLKDSCFGKIPVHSSTMTGAGKPPQLQRLIAIIETYRIKNLNIIPNVAAWYKSLQDNEGYDPRVMAFKHSSFMKSYPNFQFHQLYWPIHARLYRR